MPQNSSARIIPWFVLAVLVAAGALYFTYQSSVAHPDVTDSGTTQTPRVYQSRDLAFSFSIPDHYELTAVSNAGAAVPHQTIVLIDPATQPTGDTPTEGGPAITIDVFENPNGLGLEEWIRSTNASNYHLASGELYTLSQKIGGETAIGYRWSGLYENDTMAVAYNGRIYLFSVGWLTDADQIRVDFGDLIETVEFTD